jgi:hypothetical protein
MTQSTHNAPEATMLMVRLPADTWCPHTAWPSPLAAARATSPDRTRRSRSSSEHRSCATPCGRGDGAGLRLVPRNGSGPAKLGWQGTEALWEKRKAARYEIYPDSAGHGARSSSSSWWHVRRRARPVRGGSGGPVAAFQRP